MSKKKPAPLKSKMPALTRTLPEILSFIKAQDAEKLERARQRWQEFLRTHKSEEDAHAQSYRDLARDTLDLARPLVDAEAKRRRGKNGRMEFVGQLRAAGIKKWADILELVRQEHPAWAVVGKKGTRITPATLKRRYFDWLTSQAARSHERT